MTRYYLDDLGWLQFEQLCQSLLKATLGVSIESWGGSADLGRDAYCPHSVKLHDGTILDGPIVFQAKFVSNANAAGANPGPNLLKAVERECDRITERIAAGTQVAADQRDQRLIPALDVLASSYGFIRREWWMSSGKKGTWLWTRGLGPEETARACEHTITDLGRRFLQAVSLPNVTTTNA